MSATYINPALPSMIRGLYRADLREKSIQNMLDLAADLVQELIEVRAAALAEQESKGRRWYAACWRDDNGVLNSLESSTVLREYAEADVTRWRAAEAEEDGGQPDRVVLASKISYPWMPVEPLEGRAA